MSSKFPEPFSTSDKNLPAANTAAVVTYAATTGYKHVIGGLWFSYAGGTPTGGNIKIEDVSGTTVFSLDIDSSGIGFISFDPPKKSAAKNTALIVTLAAGGSGVVGKLNVNHWITGD